jgi:hypothetical protein
MWIQESSPVTLIPVGVDNKTGYGPSQEASERPWRSWGSLIRTKSPGQKAARERPWGSSLPTSDRTCWNLASWVIWETRFVALGSKIKSFWREVLPYEASKGVRLNLFGVFLSQIKARDNNFCQERWVSWANFDRCLLSSPLACSTLPEDWSLQAQWRWYLIPKDLETPWVAQKASPLSLWRVWGSPNLGIISIIRTVITSQAFSEEQGNSSTHPVKVSVRTKSSLEVGLPGRWMKSSCQSSPRCVPHLWVPGIGRAVLQGFHIL